MSSPVFRMLAPDAPEVAEAMTGYGNVLVGSAGSRLMTLGVHDGTAVGWHCLLLSTLYHGEYGVMVVIAPEAFCRWSVVE